MSFSQMMGIAELSNAFGVSHRSLRFYEAKDLLRPHRNGTERRYSEKDATRLQLILKGKKLGFSLEEIRRLILETEDVRNSRDDTDATARLTSAQIERQLRVLEAERQRLAEAVSELRGALDRARGAA